MSMHGCGAEGADKHFGKVLLTCAIDMRKKIEAAPLLEKRVRSLGTVVENGICRETLPVVLRPFLTSIQCEIAQNPQCFLSLSTSPSIQNGHKRTAPLRRWHNVCFGLSVNSTSVDTSGNSSEAMPGFESLQPEKGASAAEAWREWQKLQGLKPYGNHKRLIGFIITVW